MTDGNTPIYLQCIDNDGKISNLLFEIVVIATRRGLFRLPEPKESDVRYTDAIKREPNLLDDGVVDTLESVGATSTVNEPLSPVGRLPARRFSCDVDDDLAGRIAG